MSRVAWRLALASLAIALGLFALNAAVRSVRTARQRALESEPGYVAYQARVEQLRQFYRATVRSATPHRRETVPGSRFELCGVEFRYNGAGMRDDRERTLEKPPGTFRVALLSDSVGQGLYVPLERGAARVMERALEAAGRRAEVLNFSVDGFETYDEYHVLERRALAYAPDAVVLLVCLNDLFDRRRVGEVGEVAPGWWERVRTRVPVVDFALDRLGVGGQAVQWDVFAHNFRALARLARDRRVPLVVGVAPVYPVAGAEPYDALARRVLELARAEGAVTADVRARFAGVPPDALFPAAEESFLYPRDHWHPSAGGHARMGEALAAAVQGLPRPQP